jgi:hypothetical protein
MKSLPAALIGLLAVCPHGAATEEVASIERAILVEHAREHVSRHEGSVLWRVSAHAGQPEDVEVRADVVVRGITMVWSLARNSDARLPATHIIEILFKPPLTLDVENVPGVIVAEDDPTTRGDPSPNPLIGACMTRAPGHFLIGLSDREGHAQHNTALLLRRGSWVNIPIRYANNQGAAILAFAKGEAGNRAFIEAFGAWSARSVRDQRASFSDSRMDLTKAQQARAWHFNNRAYSGVADFSR